jgi:hypothetical protein
MQCEKCKKEIGEYHSELLGYIGDVPYCDKCLKEIEQMVSEQEKQKKTKDKLCQYS